MGAGMDLVLESVGCCLALASNREVQPQELQLFGPWPDVACLRPHPPQDCLHPCSDHSEALTALGWGSPGFAPSSLFLEQSPQDTEPSGLGLTAPGLSCMFSTE